MKKCLSAPNGIALLGLLASIAGCAAPGAVIQGTVSPPGYRATAAKPLHRKKINDYHLADAVIYVVPSPGSQEPKPARKAVETTPQLACGAHGFEPKAIVVALQDSLAVVNLDRRWHYPFSRSVGSAFDLGSMKPGARRMVHLRRDGLVQVFCRLHSEPSASVFVSPSPLWVRPDSIGRFSLPKLAPGTYELKAWHPVYGERRWTVQLPARGATLAVGF